jgi:hypothetical protein
MLDCWLQRVLSGSLRTGAFTETLRDFFGRHRATYLSLEEEEE